MKGKKEATILKVPVEIWKQNLFIEANKCT